MKHIILETDRLMLHEMDFSDVEALASMLQDDRVMYAYNGAFNDRETLLWLQKQIQCYNDYGFGLWGMLQKQPSLVGSTASINFGLKSCIQSSEILTKLQKMSLCETG